MAKRKLVKPEQIIDEAVPESDIEEVVGAMVDVFGEEAALPAPSPVPTDPEWKDYVLSLLLPDEVDQEGSPTCDGLRRVTELVAGTIVAVRPTIVQAPSPANERRACVTVEVHIMWGDNPSDVRIFGDGADVFEGNTDPYFARFATASALTKAEGRAYRKALKLRKILSAEEKAGTGATPVRESVQVAGMIDEIQIKSIDKYCRDLNINAEALLKNAKASKRYVDYRLIPVEAAKELLEGLNGFLQNPDSIPASLTGYKKDWRSK